MKEQQTGSAAQQQQQQQQQQEKERSVWAERQIGGGLLFTAPVVFSTDSKYFFTFSTCTRVHDVKTGEIVRVLHGHTDLVTSVIPSSSRPFQLSTTGMDGKVLLWDYNDGSLLHTYDLGAAIVKAVPRGGEDSNKLFVMFSERPPVDDEWSPDIVSDAEDNRKQSDGGKESSKKGSSKSGKDGEMHDDGDDDFEDAMMDIDGYDMFPTFAKVDIDGTRVRVTEIVSIRDASDFAASADGRFLAVAAHNKLAIVNTTITGKAHGKQLSHTFFTPTPISAVAFHPQDEFVATGETCGRIVLWRSWMTPPRSGSMTLAALNGFSLSSAGAAAVAAAGSSQPSRSTTPTLATFEAQQQRQQQQHQQQQRTDTPSEDGMDDRKNETPRTPSKMGRESLVTARRIRILGSARQRHELTRRQVSGVAAVLSRRLDAEFRKQMSGSVWTDCHWHAHVVHSIAMFPDGSHMVSGGEESVLVVWNLPTNEKRFLPRVGAPISTVSVSPDGRLFALGLLNNTVKIVDATSNRTKHVIRGFMHMHDTVDVPTGIVVAPRTGTVQGARPIVLNGVPNSLQFYDVQADRFVSELEVAPPNAVRRDAKHGSLLPVARVEHAAFTGDGRWLVTVDERVSELGGCECSLKFWLYNDDTQRFELNTRVDSPHADRVKALACHPFKHMAVTTSLDTRFKTWVVAKQTSMQRTADGRPVYPPHTWHCRSVGYYRGLTCGYACFSPDGSVLALASGSVVSLWDPVATSLQMTLSHPTPFNNDVRKVLFIQGCPLMVAITDSTIFVWNLVARNLWWSYSARTVHAAADPASSLFAVTVFVPPPKKLRRFASALKGRVDSSVHFMLVFDARNPKPQAVMRLHSPAVALAFIPPAYGKGPSSLVYMNENNELITLERGTAAVSEQTSEKSDKLPQQQPTEFESAFNAVIESAADSKKKGKKLPLPEITEVAPKNAFSMLFEGPAHTLPSLESMLPGLFERLMLKDENEGEGEEESKKVEEKVEKDETKMEDDSVEKVGEAHTEQTQSQQQISEAIPHEWIDEEFGSALFTYNVSSYDWAIHAFDEPHPKKAMPKKSNRSGTVSAPATPKTVKTPHKTAKSTVKASKTKTPRWK